MVLQWPTAVTGSLSVSMLPWWCQSLSIQGTSPPRLKQRCPIPAPGGPPCLWGYSTWSTPWFKWLIKYIHLDWATSLPKTCCFMTFQEQRWAALALSLSTRRHGLYRWYSKQTKILLEASIFLQVNALLHPEAQLDSKRKLIPCYTGYSVTMLQCLDNDLYL